MSRLMKLLVTGLVTLLALATAALPAHATTDSARAAARWVAANLAAGEVADYAPTTADALIALAAGQDPSTTDEVATLLEALKVTGPDYAAESVDGAAKLVIALDAVGEDPRTFLPGVDLVRVVADGVKPDGSFGAYVSPFSLGLGATALARTGEPVPAVLVEKLATFQLEDGSFSWGPDGDPDVDMTALGMLALMAADETTMLGEAIDWAAQAQQADGSWVSWNIVNATAILGASLTTAGIDTADAVAYLEGEQQSSGAFLNGTREDMMATVQATLLLAGVSYLDVAWDPTATAPSPEPSATPEPSVTPEPTAEPTTGPTAQPTVTPTAEPTATPVPTTSVSATPVPAATPAPGTTVTPVNGDKLPQTGTATEPWFVAAAAVVALAGAGLLLARRYAR